MAYKIIHETFWIDPGVKKLFLEARFLYLYLITNPHAHYSGLYYLPESLMREETGMRTKAIRKGFTALGDRVKYDTTNSHIWVVNMAKHQLKQNNPENMIKGIAKHLNGLPNSKLVGEFLDKYKGLKIPFAYPCLTHEEPMPESVAVAVEGSEEGAGKGELREGEPTDLKFLLKKELREAQIRRDKEKVKEIAEQLDQMDKDEYKLVKET